MTNNLIINFSEEKEFQEVKEKVAIFFNKKVNEFEELVPSLYGIGKNTYKNHIVSKIDNKIVGIFAVKEKSIYNEYGFLKVLIIGSICVDPNYRKMGIMTKMFEFLFDFYDSKVDAYILSGDYSRYVHYGFHPGEDLEKYIINNKIKSSNLSFVHLNYEDIEYVKNLQNSEEFKVVRQKDIMETLSMWKDVPFIIKENNKKIGLIVFDGRNNIIDEIYLTNKQDINLVLSSFASLFENEIYLKITPFNNYYNNLIDPNFQKTLHKERTLYRIMNREIKKLFIPRNDLI